MWGRWGLTRWKDSNSESSDKSLREVREKGNKTPSLKNKDSKSKVNFKPRGKKKNYFATEFKGNSIKDYFAFTQLQDLPGVGGRIRGCRKQVWSVQPSVQFYRCVQRRDEITIVSFSLLHDIVHTQPVEEINRF